jgi:hypothetical protein
MEHCPKCRAELPPVANFCPICGTTLKPPGESEPGQPEPGAPESGERPQPPAAAPPAWRVSPVSGVEMLGPAAMAGIAGGFLVGVPGISACGCLWMLGCGALAVFFFHKQFKRAPLANEAAKLGVLSGFCGFLVGVVVSFISFALIRREPLGLVNALRENMEQSAKLVKPEDAQQVLDMMNSPAGAVMLLLTFAAVYLLGFLAFGILGALLAGAVSRKRGA